MDALRTFEWDEAKAASNLAKHGLSFAAATAVFLDSDRVDLDSTLPAHGEPRRKVIGRLPSGLVVVVVVYTERGEATRIISARRASKKEVRSYGNG